MVVFRTRCHGVKYLFLLYFQLDGCKQACQFYNEDSRPYQTKRSSALFDIKFSSNAVSWNPKNQFRNSVFVILYLNKRKEWHELYQVNYFIFILAHHL